MKTKKGVPGMERIHQQFADLDDKWLDVKVASEQRRKALESMVSDIREFKDAGVHLQKWIAQKDKMVAVLGPVATEPSQIHNQLEQVKVLKEELAGQEPLYERLIQTGHAILDKCQPDSTDAAHISEKMAVISKCWDQLSSRLGERDKTLIAVEGMSAEFNDTLQTLHDWLNDYSDRVDGVITQPTNPEEHQRQLHRLQSMEGELTNQQPLLNKLKDLGKKVGDNTKDLSTKAELKNKIAGIEKPIVEMESQLAAKKASIEQSSQEGQQFQEGCQDILYWVSDLREKLQEQPPVSGNPDLLREQAQQQKLISQDIQDRGAEVRDILRKGNKLLDTLPPSKHTKELAEKLEDIKAEWEELNRQAYQRAQQIDASQKHAQNFQDQLDKILLWLSMDDEKLAGIVPKSLDKDVIARKLKDAQSLQADILKHSHDHDNLNREGQSLIGLVDTDQNHVTDTLEDANKRWETLSQAVADRVEELEDLSQRLEEFHDNMRESESMLEKYKDKLDGHHKQGNSSRDPKHIDKIKAWQEDVDVITSQIDYAEALLDGLQDHGDITAPLVNNLEKAKHKHDELKQDLTQLVEEMESGAMVLSQYQDLVQTVGSELASLDTEFSALDPVGRDESMLRGQQRENEDLLVEIEEFVSKLHNMEAKIDDVKRKTDGLKASGYLTDTGVLSPMKQIHKQFENLKNKAEKRKDDLEETFRKMEAVDDNLRRMRTSIDRASAELDMHEPIGHDVEAIKQQQEELKLFQKSVLDPLMKRVDAVQGDAQALVQTSAPGVNTGGLESDLEIMVDKWSELNEKVLEREHNLDNALLQAGKFNDALDSLLSWLKETEDMVQNQKSPSTDYKVVKAQLQEQKFLMKMLDDRESSVKSAKQLADNLLKNLDSREQKAIQNQSAQLQQRWDVLRQNAANRLEKLEDMVGLTKDYQEVRDPLTQWLDLTEKKFASLEPSVMDTEGIENIITSLQDMEEDISNQEYNFQNLDDKSNNLQKYCSGPDAETLDKKTNIIQNRFSDLCNKVSDSAEQMEEALPLAKNFNEAHASFLDWVLKMEPQLRAKEATGPEAFEQVQHFIQQLQEIQPVIEVINTEGNQLAELAPGDAGLRVEDSINKNMKRYEAVNDNIQRRSQKLRSTKQRSSEIVNDMNDLIEWFDDEAKKISSAEPINSDPGKLTSQIAEQKAINDDINNQKVKAREFITKGKKLLRESSFEDDPQLRERVEHLKHKVDAVGKLGVDRLSQLEQTLPLAKAFYDTHQDLATWFDEVDPILTGLDVMSIDADHVKKQQDQVKVLKQEVQDHKPVIDRLNKTGNALVKLCGEQDCLKVQKMLDKDNKKLDNMRNSLRDRSLSIDEALQQSAEFTDKLEDMLETLATTSEQIENAEPVSAHPDKLREQLAENKALLEDMEMRQTALQSIKTTAEDLIKQASSDQDEAVRDVQQKLGKLINFYEGIKDTTHFRTQTLENTLDVSERFWDDLHSLASTIKDLQDAITQQDPPALEPAIIREQQDYLEALKDDIEATQADIEDVTQTGDQLVELCGKPDRPEVEKNINDLQSNLGTVADKFEKRSKDLEVALTKAVHFQDELMKILVWLQKHEVKVREFGHVGTDFDTIKIQWNQVKDLKAKVEPKQVDVESLNQKANDLAKDSTPEHAAVVKEPMSNVNKRWDNLLEGLGDRERKLQMAMLNVGQFEHALNELLAWLDKTDQSLDDATSSHGDHKHLEIELAKLKVIQNDIDGHKESVDSLKEAGVRVVAKEAGSDTPVKRKLNEINTMWGRVQEKCNDKYKRLKEALREAKSFAGDLQDILSHMSELEGCLITSTPVGGLPETAREQLEKFMNVYNELENTDAKIAKLSDSGIKLAAKKTDGAANSIKQSLGVVDQRWENIKTRAEDRKAKLEKAVGQANSFSDDLNRFIAWLTDTEKTLNNLKPVSRLLDRTAVQIEDHKALQKDVSKNRETMIALDKTGTHLKYFSQKQDVILIKNLLASVQHRWEKIVSRTAERTRHLERGYKEAKQFHAMWRELLDWLLGAEKTLDAHQQVGNDPIKIKEEIAKHKEYQRGIGTRQPLYDSINRSGRTLKDKCPPEDVTEIQRMLIELKTKWNTVCSKSVDRQRQLEEALLFAGQFSEALQALLDWLGKVEPTLGEDQPVHGDIDTVNNLMESHKAYQQELGARANTVAFVRKRAKELMDKSEGDLSQQQAELIELSTLWDRVCKLSVNKQERLDQAHKLAEEFHKKAQGLLDWLASAERQLRYRGPIPEDEHALIKHIEEHKKFEEDLMRQEANLRETLNIGHDIIKRCHPDAVSTLKHWLSALKARWEELTGLCKTRGRKLAEGLSTVRANTRLLDDLLGWLTGAESTLINVDQEPIPGDIQVINDLIKDHQHFSNEVSSRQPDVDRLIKADKQRTTSTSEPASYIPVLRGTSGRHTPVKLTSRKDTDSGRRTPEPTFRNPRTGALFNKWRGVWLMTMDRQRKLQDALDHLNEVEKLKNFKFEPWRKRFLQWMRHNKSRIMELFRRIDRDKDGRITRKEFIDGIISTKFPTSQLEMDIVANLFDRDGSGLIDYKEFVSALRPDTHREPEKTMTDAEKIHDEVHEQVSKCTCVKQFRIHKIGEGKYRFGDSQKLRLVRILRSTVMVRVGGGWVALDEFLVKNDPCRAKGRTNIELREQFILAQGVSQSMTGFTSKSPGGSSYSGSSQSAGSWSTRSPNSATGPITKIREKTQYPTPWRQRVKNSPDIEVSKIMSSDRSGKPKASRDIMKSPGTPVSRSSSRASTNSRPPSRADSEASETSEPEIFTTVQQETKNIGGRNTTTMTYQTHVIQTRRTSTPTSASKKVSKIPKPSPARKK